MSGLAAIREGLRANLASIPGCQVSGYMLSSPTPPTLQVFPSSSEGVTYHQSMRNGMVTWALIVQGIVSNNSDEGSQRLLDEWLEPTGSQSVFAAIESDRTLGGAADDVTVMGNTGYQEYVSDKGQFVACSWTVNVIARGDS